MNNQVKANEIKTAAEVASTPVAAAKTVVFSDSDKKTVEDAMQILRKEGAASTLSNVELPVISKVASLLNKYYADNQAKARTDMLKQQLKLAEDMNDFELVEFYTNAINNLSKGRSLVASEKSVKEKTKVDYTTENTKYYELEGKLIARGNRGKAPADSAGNDIEMFDYEKAVEKFGAEKVDTALKTLQSK